MFVNHAKAGRSGHLGHALVEYSPGKIVAFYANCSDFHKGHSGDGSMEYRHSEDGGCSWGEPSALEYSRETYEKGVGHSVMCEKAVRTDDGAIILFNLECKGKAWKPLAVPTCLRSADGGLTWESAKSMGDQPGRIWDAMLSDSCIFVWNFVMTAKSNGMAICRNTITVYMSAWTMAEPFPDAVSCRSKSRGVAMGSWPRCPTAV